MLHSSMDPSKAAGAGTLEGPLFGIPDAFQGFGIAFDTYDNDGARDNPAVFVLKNFAADESHAPPTASFSHNADFSQDMVCASGTRRCRSWFDFEFANMRCAIPSVTLFTPDALVQT